MSKEQTVYFSNILVIFESADGFLPRRMIEHIDGKMRGNIFVENVDVIFNQTLNFRSILRYHDLPPIRC